MATGRRPVRGGGAGGGTRPEPGVGGARPDGDRDEDARRAGGRDFGAAGGRGPEGSDDDLRTRVATGRRRVRDGGAGGGPRPEPGAGGGRREGERDGDREGDAPRGRRRGSGAAGGRGAEGSDDGLRTDFRSGSRAGVRLRAVPSRPVLVFTGAAPRLSPLWREPSDGRRGGGTPLETFRRVAGGGCDPGERRPLRRRLPERAREDGHGQRPMARRRRAEAEVSAWRKGAAGVRSVARRRCFRP